MRRPRPVAVPSAVALIVIVLAILAQQIFRSRTNGHPPTVPTDNRSADVAPSDAAVTRPDVAFRSRQALDDHYRKHAREFGPNVSRDAYLRRAQSLRDAPAGGAILESKRPDGVTTRFDRRTGDFLAFNPDHTIRTFFRPNDGERYFHRQVERADCPPFITHHSTLAMPPPDPSQAYLKSRGLPQHIVVGGLAGLLDRWGEVVATVQTGYPLTLDDYLNDMDLRQLIDDALPHASMRGHKQALVRLYQLDEDVRPHLAPTDRCLWGTKAEAQHGWTPEHNWWYFSVPRAPGAQLAGDLAGFKQP